MVGEEGYCAVARGVAEVEGAEVDAETEVQAAEVEEEKPLLIGPRRIPSVEWTVQYCELWLTAR